MAPTSILMLIGIVLGFVAAMSLSFFVMACVRGRAGERRSQDRLQHTTWYAGVVRNGVGWAKPLAKLLLKVARINRMFSEAVVVMRAKGFATQVQSLCSTWCAAIAVIMGVGTFLGASPVFGIAAATCFAVVGYFAIERYKDKRAEQMRESVPDVLRSMGVCFHAGFTLLQTFQQIASEIRGPLGSLFSRAAHELETGVSAEEVLVSFRDQASIPELAFVAVALKVQHDAGGSMAAILDAARDSVQGEIELKRSLKVQTAQAKLSARVVTALPFVLIALFSLITEDFLAPFFSSAIGLILLAVAIAMQATGVLIVRGMLKVECD